jgi:hypothetical protein
MRARIFQISGGALLLSLLVVLFLASGITNASVDPFPHNFCASGFGPWDLSDLPIPVFLNENLDDQICPNSDCTDFDEIRRSILVTMDEFYDNSSSGVEFFYAGTTNANVGEIIPKAVHVYAGDGCQGAVGLAAWEDTDGDGKTDYGKVRMCITNNTQPLGWRSFPGSSNSPSIVSWQGVLAQELAHVLGFDHPIVCGQNFKSILGTVDTNAHHGHHLFRDDIDAFQNKYQIRDKEAVGFWSNSQGNVWKKEVLPTDLNAALSRFSACNTAASLATFVSYPNDRTPRLINIWRLTATGWKALDSPFAVSEYHTGTACKDFNSLAVAWLGGYNAGTGMQTVFLTTTENGGETWINQEIASGNMTTRNAGVSTAYDPESDTYIVLWRDNSDQILSKVAAPNAPIVGFQDPEARSLWRASDSVSISCGPVAEVGSENCLVAWADVGWNRGLRWAHAHVDTTGNSPQLVLGPVLSHGYVIYGTPSVAYVTGSDFPWILTFHQGGQTAYVVWKSADTNATWQNERGLSVDRKIVNPVIATWTGEADDVSGNQPDWIYVLFTTAGSP